MYAAAFAAILASTRPGHAGGWLVAIPEYQLLLKIHHNPAHSIARRRPTAPPRRACTSGEMMMPVRKAAFFMAMLASMLLVVTSFASAGALSNVFVYGDSLSDTGNIFTFSGGNTPPSPPYYNG